MKRLLAFAAFLFCSLPALAATQEEIANAPAQTVDAVYVWIFLLGFIGALVAGCVWYFFSDEKKEK
jgi:hypothetical protein